MEIIIILLVITQLLSFILIYNLLGKEKKHQQRIEQLENIEESISDSIMVMAQGFEEDNHKVVHYLQQVKNDHIDLKERMNQIEQALELREEYMTKIEMQLNKKTGNLDRIGKDKEENQENEKREQSPFLYSSPFHEEVLELAKKGHSLKEICKLLNKSETEISLLLKLKQNEGN